MKLTISRVRASMPDATPQLITSALRILKIPFKRGQVSLMDKEYMLYDAKIAFRAKAKLFHADVGGSDAAMRPVLEAFRLVKRYCSRKPQTVPPDPAYELREARRRALDSL